MEWDTVRPENVARRVAGMQVKDKQASIRFDYSDYQVVMRSNGETPEFERFMGFEVIERFKFL